MNCADYLIQLFIGIANRSVGLWRRDLSHRSVVALRQIAAGGKIGCNTRHRSSHSLDDFE